jgi:hypothetical protein
MKTNEYKDTKLQRCRVIYTDMWNRTGKVDRVKALQAFMSKVELDADSAKTYYTKCRKEWSKS